MKDDIKVTSRVLEKAGQPHAIMTRDSTQSRAEGKGESEPTQSVGGVLSLKQVVIRKAACVTIRKAAGVTRRKVAGVTMDVDGNNIVNIIDLFLVITGWFAFSFMMLLCYFCFDVFDRARRNRNIELGKDTEMNEFQDEYEKVDNESSETDDSDVSEDYSGIVIVSGEQVSFTKDLA